MITNFDNGQWIEADCFEAMRDIPDGIVDMILCDLPYGTTACKWDSVIPFEPLWEHYWRVAKPNAAVVLTSQCPFDKALGASQLQHLKYEWIWEKPKATGHLNAKKQPMKAHENVLVFYRSQCLYNPQGTITKVSNSSRPAKGKQRGEMYGVQQSIYGDSTVGNYPRSVVEFSGVHKPHHPTQKPVALFEYLIRTYTNPGDVVLDNCAGSGTTAIAAENCGRKWICIERDPEYSAKAIERIRKHRQGVEA